MLKSSILIDVVGYDLSQEDINRISHPLVCGVILFSRNYKNKAQLLELIKHIKLVRADLLISVDHEGGRVQRFKEEFFLLPSMGKLGDIFIQDQTLALRLAGYSGWLIAKELGEVGIDLNFSPVLDINYGKSSVIGNRSFSNDARTVIFLAKQFINGLNAGGMSAVGKHFPGHGFIPNDSHHEITTDLRTIEEMSDDLNCFKSFIDDDIAALMPSHVIYNQVDIKPASLSKKWILEYLRKILKFKGIVISDDLSMRGVADYIPDIYDRVMEAFNAGCNIVLICNEPNTVDELLDQVNPKNVKPQNFKQIRLNQAKNKNLRFDNFTLDEVKHFMIKESFVENA